MMTISVHTWWMLLCTVAAINISAWCYAARVLYRDSTTLPADQLYIRRLQLSLAALYVFGCAFRSVLPVYDIPRICMVNTWLSSVAVGRSVATIAEVAFVAQLAVMLNQCAKASGSLFARQVSYILVPFILIAETSSWYAVLTTENIGHVIEESIWGICAGLIVVSLIAMRWRFARTARYVIDACAVAGACYVAYMFWVDVPMYWDRWLAAQATGHHYMTVLQGFADVASRWRVSQSWHDWYHEVPWMTLYFSVAVWMSISLVHAPSPHAHILGKRSKPLSPRLISTATSK